MAIAALVVFAVGLVSGVGLIPSYSVVPLATTPPPTLQVNVETTEAGFNVTANVSIAALPVNEMNVTSVSIHWGPTTQSYSLNRTKVTGYFHVLKTYSYALAGTYSVTASASAHIGTANYATKTAPVLVTVPSTGTSQCKSSCLSVVSAFTSVENGLSVVFTDRSQVTGATNTTFAWTFGDGASASGATVTHAYAVAGTFTVTETVTATDATGAQAVGSSSYALNVSAASTGCQGSGQCAPAAHHLVTPWSGLLMGVGLGLGALVFLWGRPDLGAIALGVLGFAGFALGMFNVGAW